MVLARRRRGGGGGGGGGWGGGKGCCDGHDRTTGLRGRSTPAPWSWRVGVGRGGAPASRRHAARRAPGGARSAAPPPPHPPPIPAAPAPPPHPPPRASTGTSVLRGCHRGIRQPTCGKSCPWSDSMERISHHNPRHAH